MFNEVFIDVFFFNNSSKIGDLGLICGAALVTNVDMGPIRSSQILELPHALLDEIKMFVLVLVVVLEIDIHCDEVMIGVRQVGLVEHEDGSGGRREGFSHLDNCVISFLELGDKGHQVLIPGS